jgi:hypothetical protein
MSRCSYPSLLNFRRLYSSYVTINIANENVMNFLAVFTLLRVYIFTRFENILLSYHANSF